MDIIAIWLLYIVIVIVLWFLFWYPKGDHASGLSALFYSLLIAFLVIYLITPSVNTNLLSDEEKAWFNALLALSILLPIIVIGLMITYVYQRIYNYYESNSGNMKIDYFNI